MAPTRPEVNAATARTRRFGGTRWTRTPLAALLLAPAMAGCQFTASADTLDYTKVENAIADELNASYAAFAQQVSAVDCPRSSEEPKAGDSFVCTASVGGQTVRVEAKVTDDDFNVSFSTLDALFDLESTSGTLTDSLSEQYGFDVSVTCGEGLKVVPIGQSFDCTAVDPQGNTRTVRLTAGAVGESDHWEVVD